MGEAKGTLKGIEIIIIFIAINIGERLISLSGTSTQKVGYASILSIIVGGILALIVSCFLARLSLNFPNKTIIEFSQEILGKVLGKIAVFIFFMYFFIFSAIYARRFGEFLRQELLYNTPIEFIMITLIFASAYCAIGGIPLYSKVCNVLTTLAFMAVVLLFLAAIPFTKFEELLPAFQIESIKNIHLLSPGLIDFLGIEIVLFLVPFVKKPKDIMKNTFIGVLMVVITFVFDVILSMGILSKGVLEHKYYTLFAVAKTLTLPGFYDIRFDILFASLWIFLVYTVMVGYHYLTSLSLSGLCGLKSYSVFVLLLIPLFFMVGLIPQNLGETLIVLNLLGWGWFYGILGTTLLIYIVGIIRKKVSF